MIENLLKGQKYRVAINADTDEWNKLSFETCASDIKYNDGQTGEVKSDKLKQVSAKLDALTTDITKIKRVSVLPSDAASHPDTLYLITDM